MALPDADTNASPFACVSGCFISGRAVLKVVPPTVQDHVVLYARSGSVHAAKRVRPKRTIHDVLGLEGLHSCRRIGRKIPHGGGRDDRARGRRGGGNERLIDGQHGQERLCVRHGVEARPDEDEAVDLYTLFPIMKYREI